MPALVGVLLPPGVNSVIDVGVALSVPALGTGEAVGVDVAVAVDVGADVGVDVAVAAAVGVDEGVTVGNVGLGVPTKVPTVGGLGFAPHVPPIARPHPRIVAISTAFFRISKRMLSQESKYTLSS